MRRPIRLLAPFLAAAALLCLPATATIPSDSAERAVERLLHVCGEHVEPGDPRYIVCTEQEGGEGTPYTGSECIAAGYPAECWQDVVPDSQLRGTLWLIHDDHLGHTALWMEFREGGQRHILVDLFDTGVIGNWNDIDDETVLFGPIPVSQDGAFNILDGNLTDLADEVRAIVEASRSIDLSNSVPLILFLGQKDDRESDHSDPNDPLASATPWGFKIEFRRTRD